MSAQELESNPPNPTWQPWQAYLMAALCLLIGVVVGYLVRGSAPVAASSIPAAQPAASAPASPNMPSLEDMRRMADKQAQPLLLKLEADPHNSDLLNQVGSIYRVTHDFKKAMSFYEKSLASNPKNVGARTDLASCLYYLGDVDAALVQLQKSLTYDPKHAGTLFNLGLIRWQGKGDATGAIDAWEKLLKTNPEFANRKAVEKLIADARSRQGGGLIPQ